MKTLDEHISDVKNEIWNYDRDDIILEMAKLRFDLRAKIETIKHYIQQQKEKNNNEDI